MSENMLISVISDINQIVHPKILINFSVNLNVQIREGDTTIYLTRQVLCMISKHLTQVTITLRN